MRRIEDFLHTILTFEYPARHPFQINQLDGQGQSALYMFTMRTCSMTLLSSNVPVNFMRSGLDTIKLFLLAGANPHVNNNNNSNRQQSAMLFAKNLRSESFLKFLNPEYYNEGLFFYDSSMSQIYKINAKRRIIRAMFEVDGANKRKDEFAQALDAAVEKAIAQETIIETQRTKKHRNITFALAASALVAFVCKKYNAQNVIASGFKWVTEKCNILAPRIVSTVTGC